MNLPSFLFFLAGIIGVTMSTVLFTIQSHFPHSAKGIDQLAKGLLLLCLSLSLLIARGHIPDFFSIIIANLMIIIGIILIGIAIGNLSHSKFPVSRIQVTLILSSFFLLFIWFTYISPSILTRTIINCLYTLMLVYQAIVFLKNHFDSTTGRNLMIASLSLIVISRLTRTATILFGIDTPKSLFDESITNLILLAMPSVIIPLIAVSAIMLVSENLKQKLESLNRYDELTECLNKKTIHAELKREINRSKRHHTKLTTMMLDLDDFKNINDQHGHLMGDQVLINFARTIKQLLRANDELGRFGGDEFLVLLPDTSAQEAKLLCKRIEELAEKSNPRWNTSIGISEWKGKGDSIESLLKRADSALYRAKASGKNQAFFQ